MFDYWRSLWARLLDLERDDYPHTATSEQLSSALKEVASQARTVFLIYVTLTSYAVVTLTNVRDSDFFGSSPGVKLPLVDVSPNPALFFAIMPVVLIALAAYLHIYIAQMHRIRRRMEALRRRGGLTIDPDTLYPWIATLMLQGGVYGRFVRVIYSLLVWWATPVIIMLYWLRLLVTRGSLRAFIQGEGPPSAWLVGALGIISIAAVLVWSQARHALDASYGLRAPPSKRRLLAGVFICVMTLVVVASQSAWQPVLCDRISVRAVCGLTLRQKFFAEPPSDRSKRAMGTRMRGADLSYADLSWAFLDNSDLTGASMTRSNLTGTSFDGANLVKVTLDGALIVDTKFKDAWLSDVSMRDELIQGADLTGADLSDANLSGSMVVSGKLTGANLWRARCYGTSFVGSHMEGATVEQAFLEAADFSGAHLEVTDFSQSHLEGAVFKGAFLSGANFKDAFLDGADFTGAVFEGAQTRSSDREAPMEESVRKNLQAGAGQVANFEGATARVVCGRTPVASWRLVKNAAECKSVRAAAIAARAGHDRELARVWKKFAERGAFVQLQDYPW